MYFCTTTALSGRLLSLHSLMAVKCNDSHLSNHRPPLLPQMRQIDGTRRRVCVCVCVVGAGSRMAADWLYLLTRSFGPNIESLCKAILRMKLKFVVHLSS